MTITIPYIAFALGMIALVGLTLAVAALMEANAKMRARDRERERF